MSTQFQIGQVPSDWTLVETSDEAVHFIVRMLRGGQLRRDWPFILAHATKQLHEHDSFDAEQKMDARANERGLKAEYRSHHDY